MRIESGERGVSMGDKEGLLLDCHGFWQSVDLGGEQRGAVCVISSFKAGGRIFLGARDAS